MDQPTGTIDLTGQKHGKLTVVGYAGSSDKGSMWACTCACGGSTTVRRDRLVKGKTTSCGCARQNSRAKLVDGVPSSAHPLYKTWGLMRNRCRNPRNQRYASYGGRGSTVDPRWDSFEQFVADMGPQPTPQHTVDRIDNNGPYSPENCRWATGVEQCANRRGPNPPVLLGGERMPMEQAAKKLGVTVAQVQQFMGLSAQGAIDLIARARSAP
jgi:hypothetical protein